MLEDTLDISERRVNVLALGAGVQSTALLLMSLLEPEFSPKPDIAIFADTGWEPQAVYKHLEWLTGYVAALDNAIPIVGVSAGNIKEDALDYLNGKAKRWSNMPFYTRNAETGKTGIIQRHCTSDYKIYVLNKYAARWKKQGVNLIFGISLDEFTRMKSPRAKWITNSYPLVDRRLTRHDCMLWLQRNGFPPAPKSACVVCPFRTVSSWRHLRDTSPAEFAEAVEFDNLIRRMPHMREDTYLFRGRVPLESADLRTAEEKGQTGMFSEDELSGFDDECEGVCGI